MKNQRQNEADAHGGERTVNEPSLPNEALRNSAPTVMPSNPEEMCSKPHSVFTTTSDRLLVGDE